MPCWSATRKIEDQIMLDLFFLILAFSVHTIAFILGLVVLHKNTDIFTNQPCLLANGLDEIEISYLSIVFSTLVAPATAYHLYNMTCNSLSFSDINEWDAAYWVALGFLLMLFHLITNSFMEKVRHGLGRNIIETYN